MKNLNHHKIFKNSALQKKKKNEISFLYDKILIRTTCHRKLTFFNNVNNPIIKIIRQHIDWLSVLRAMIFKIKTLANFIVAPEKVRISNKLLPKIDENITVKPIIKFCDDSHLRRPKLS